MQQINRFGLRRPIPEPDKREIRRRCGFGCVICGASIVDYEHVIPTFEDSPTHDVDKIALLCPSHHAEVTRGFMSKNRVMEALADPFCKRAGYSFGALEAGKQHPIIKFASCTFTNCEVPLAVEDDPLIKIEMPEEPGGPYRISASFYDQNSEQSLVIFRNEWKASSDKWDVEVAAGRIIVRSGLREISLQLHFQPGLGISIERLNMRYKTIHFLADARELRVANGISNIFQDCEVNGPTGFRFRRRGGFSVG